MIYNTKKSADEEVMSEVARAAILYVDYARSLIEQGLLPADLPAERARLFKAVDTLRMVRRQSNREHRRGRRGGANAG